MRFARALRPIATASLVCSIFACASLLDIRELPLASSDATVDADVDDAGDACAVGKTFCEQQCPAPFFCDDFESRKLGERWTGLLGLQNPIFTGDDGSVTLGTDDKSLPSSQMLVAEAVSTSSSSAAAILATGLDASKIGARGMRLRFSVRPSRLGFINDGGGARKIVTIFAFGSQAFNRGIGVNVVDERGNGELDLVLQERQLGGRQDLPEIDLTTILTRQANADVTNNRVKAEITIGSLALLKERNLICSLDPEQDAGGPEDLKLHMRFGDALQKCTVLYDVLADKEWLKTTALLAGASVSDFGSARVLLDDIAVDFIL